MAKLGRQKAPKDYERPREKRGQITGEKIGRTGLKPARRVTAPSGI